MSSVYGVSVWGHELSVWGHVLNVWGHVLSVWGHVLTVICCRTKQIGKRRLKNTLQKKAEVKFRRSVT